jgi:hypothetical protein
VEDAELKLDGLYLEDKDIDGRGVIVTMSVDSGRLFVGNVPAQAILFIGSRDGSSTVQFGGSLEEINAILSTVTFLGDPDWNGKSHGFATLDILIEDNGKPENRWRRLFNCTIKCG